MSKINIRVNIKNEEIDNVYETGAILQDNKIKYIENDKTVTCYNLKEDILSRENTSLRMDYNFKKKHGTIYIKKLGKNIEIKIDIIKFIKENNNVYIEYKVEKDNFKYRIEEIK